MYHPITLSMKNIKNISISKRLKTIQFVGEVKFSKFSSSLKTSLGIFKKYLEINGNNTRFIRCKKRHGFEIQRHLH
ncbi:CLUMA_CG017513, isoform A [Clunio marinus]|uniref:CLUMA_CG017513, isoform A n=1 Tax=Clunio marinus TaxID=568069 RepID=A0A1J1IXY7_9DIPT|nr:CLUMA_CG017513, isoform A [Clunio marinus]